MQELLKVIAQGLVEEPSQVSVDKDEPNEEGVIVYHIHVAEDDMGRIIGKQGRIAKAIRTIARSAAIRNNTKVMVEIDLLPVFEINIRFDDFHMRLHMKVIFLV